MRRGSGLRRVGEWFEEGGVVVRMMTGVSW